MLFVKLFNYKQKHEIDYRTIRCVIGSVKQGVNVKKENQILMWLSSDKISFMKWLYTQLSLIK